MIKTIAVITANIEDFKNWKKENNIHGNIIDDFNKVITDETIYHRISTLCDMCSLTVDEVIATEKAKHCEIFETLIKESNRCLRENMG